MIHINLKTCSSTQTYLKELIEKDPSSINKDILVTTLMQTDGIGRSNNHWHYFKDAIALSCIIPAIGNKSLTPLKIGVLLSNFFEQKYGKKVYLKWPNDLMTKAKLKVGGIIAQLQADYVLVGVGINLLEPYTKTEMPFEYDALFKQENSFNIENFSKEIYQFLLENISQAFSPKDWMNLCCHLNQEVEIRDDFEVIRGKFVGISSCGEALIEKNSKIIKVINGSLFLT